MGMRVSWAKIISFDFPPMRKRRSRCFWLSLLLWLWLPSCPAAAPASLRDASPKFYPGIAEYQSIRAHEALRFFYNGDKPHAVQILHDLGKHEQAGQLPPLSRLLLCAMHGLTLQRNETGTTPERIRVRAAFDSAAEQGLRRCASGVDDEDIKATCSLIEGGIRGFRAILELDARAPTEVLAEGLEAVSLLEAALETDSTLRDAHLGLGLFNVMAASNTPRIVRGMLRAAGRGVSHEAGLAHLRRSGYEGQYTSVASQFFLIRFLSPYDDELRREKSEIFRSLRATFPLSPFVPFLQNHEALVFHPEGFYRPQARTALARAIRTVEARDYANQRYLQLLKHQYGLLADQHGDAVAARYRPDSGFDLGGYAFYPGFMEALRLRRAMKESGPPAPPGVRSPRGPHAENLKRIAAMRQDILTRLRKTDRTLLNPQTRALFEWHVNHALRPEQFEPALTENGDSGTPRSGRGLVPPTQGVAETTSNAAGKSRKPPER